jgi:hypothetical protein
LTGGGAESRRPASKAEPAALLSGVRGAGRQFRSLDGGDQVTYRTRWTRLGEDAYEAWRDAKDQGDWKTMFKVVLKRSK